MAERTIRHGMFRYYELIDNVDAAGNEVQTLVERFAMHNETVDIPREADVKKGEAAGAFYSDDELQKLKLGKYAQAVPTAPAEVAVSGTVVKNDEGDDVDLAEADEEELDDWLLSTGQFDGKTKPSVDVVVAVGGQDPDLADALLDAEARTHDQPRKGVTEGLKAIIESRNQ
jgi:hypothetical protein